MISSKYPDIKKLNPLQQVLWVLEISFKELYAEALPAKTLSEYLWYFRIHIEPRRITNILNAARGKVKNFKQVDVTYYAITNEGQAFLYGNVDQTLIQDTLFSKDLISSLGKKFEKEIKQLNTCYFNECGDATAFLLRKILEKAIYLAFAKNGKLDKLKNPIDSSKYLGLEKMIHVASTEKAIDGTPFILPKTASELSGIKFLGDTAAHDFLYNVDIKDINHELSIVRVAIGQIAKKL